MASYKPTYLYVKAHLLTGMLYFGKTVRKQIHSYHGSGKLWTRHINKHGREHVITLWYQLFEDQQSLINFALEFSRINNIVVSKDWANLKEENGLDGGSPKGRSAEALAKISRANKGKIISEETKAKMSATAKARKRQPLSDAAKAAISKGKIGKLQSEETKARKSAARKAIFVTCPHCHKSGGGSMYRWHFNNCKARIPVYCPPIDVDDSY